MKFNTFNPYFKLLTPINKQMNDIFQFQVYWCNYIGLTISVNQYGFDLGVLLFNVHKKEK